MERRLKAGRKRRRRKWLSGQMEKEMVQHEEIGLWERIFSRSNLFRGIGTSASQWWRSRGRRDDRRGTTGTPESALGEHTGEARGRDLSAKPGTAGRDTKAERRGAADRDTNSAQDRLIQQAMHQILSLEYEPRFSEHSYGFRPRRSAHDAVKAAQRTYRSGLPVGGGH